jgi:hypothetical protein
MLFDSDWGMFYFVTVLQTSGTGLDGRDPALRDRSRFDWAILLRSLGPPEARGLTHNL